MNAKYFYVYIILGMIFVGLIIYNVIVGRTAGFTLIYDAIIALVCFYRGYRIYMSKKDQELM